MGEYPRGKQGQGQDLFACGESALWHHAVNQPRGGGGSRHREMGLAFHARWFVRIGGKWMGLGSRQADSCVSGATTQWLSSLRHALEDRFPAQKGDGK
jgi:hypothetical protein